MKKINIRQLLRDYVEATKELPVIVTRYGKPVFIISKPKETDDTIK